MSSVGAVWITPSYRTGWRAIPNGKRQFPPSLTSVVKLYWSNAIKNHKATSRCQKKAAKLKGETCQSHKKLTRNFFLVDAVFIVHFIKFRFISKILDCEKLLNRWFGFTCSLRDPGRRSQKMRLVLVVAQSFPWFLELDRRSVSEKRWIQIHHSPYHRMLFCTPPWISEKIRWPFTPPLPLNSTLSAFKFNSRATQLYWRRK